MRIVCFERRRRASIGVLVEGGVIDLGQLLGDGCPQAGLRALIDNWDELADAISDLCRSGRVHPLEGVSLRASVPAPGKVLCVMRNRPTSPAPPWAYLKYSDGGVGTGATLPMPSGEEDLYFEPEVAVVLRGPARDVQPDAWRDVVFGYTAFLDVVRPGSGLGAIEGEDWWKSWDTAFAVGPAIVTATESGEPELKLSLTVSNASETVTAADPGQPPIGEIIAFLSSVMTLHSGDLIACGAHVGAVLPAARGSRARLDLLACGALVVQAAV